MSGQRGAQGPCEALLGDVRPCGEPGLLARGGCVHEHVKERHLCEWHRKGSGAAVMACGECYDHGHVCLVTIAEVVAS